MPRNVLVLSVIVLAFSALFGQTKTFGVKYVSADHVYLQGGKKDSLRVGDVLKVLRGRREIGTVRVEYVSAHSASCGITDKKADFKAGDQARLMQRAEQRKTIQARATTPRRRVNNTAETVTKSPAIKSKTRVRGYVSLQYYYFHDTSQQRFDFSQPTLRFRLSVTRLWQRHFNLEIRFRSRYNQRQRRINGIVPRSEWQNRLYTFTFSYDAPQAIWNFRIGRIISNAFSGVGYIDGTLVKARLGAFWHAGVFAGTQPDGRTSAFRTEVQKYGGFVRFLQGNFAGNRLEVLWAGVGEYHGSAISREFTYLQTSYYHGRRFSLYQNIELDINRGWRRQRSGQALSLSGLYCNASYHYSPEISASLSYDNRKNYYTYEIRSLADSLFDAAFRQGLRLSVFTRVSRNYRIALNLGLREKSTDVRYSYSYGLRVTRRNFFGAANRMAFRFNGFDNVFASGYNPNLTFTRHFSNGHFVSLAYNGYMYALKNQSQNRFNQWIRLYGQLELPARLYVQGSVEYSFGDDVKGYRTLVECGYRF